MRNAVIRKKVLKEHALFRRYMFTPQRLVVPAADASWDAVNGNYTRLWATK